MLLINIVVYVAPQLVKLFIVNANNVILISFIPS